MNRLELKVEILNKCKYKKKILGGKKAKTIFLDHNFMRKDYHELTCLTLK